MSEVTKHDTAIAGYGKPPPWSGEPKHEIPPAELKIIQTWLAHHKVDYENGVFLGDSTVYDNGKAPKSYDFDFIFDLVLRIKGTITFPSTLTAGFYVWLPFQGWVYVMGINGDLMEGITFNVNVTFVVKGTFKLYIQTKAVWLSWNDVWVIGAGSLKDGSAKLFDMPWLGLTQ